MKKEIQFDKRRYFTLEEAEDVFGIHAETLRKWIKRDESDGIPKLPSFKPGKNILIPKDALELYIKKFPVSA